MILWFSSIKFFSGFQINILTETYGFNVRIHSNINERVAKTWQEHWHVTNKHRDDSLLFLSWCFKRLFQIFNWALGAVVNFIWIFHCHFVWNCMVKSCKTFKIHEREMIDIEWKLQMTDKKVSQWIHFIRFYWVPIKIISSESEIWILLYGVMHLFFTVWALIKFYLYGTF